MIFYLTKRHLIVKSWECRKTLISSLHRQGILLRIRNSRLKSFSTGETNHWSQWIWCPTPPHPPAILVMITPLCPRFVPDRRSKICIIHLQTIPSCPPQASSIIDIRTKFTTTTPTAPRKLANHLHLLEIKQLQKVCLRNVRKY